MKTILRSLLIIVLAAFHGYTQPICNAHFNYQPAGIPNTLSFTIIQPSAAAQYFWNFGDGHTSTLANPHHTFAPGIYNVCLAVTVIGPNGTQLCTANYCDSIHIPVNIPTCNAHFMHQPIPGSNAIAFAAAANPPSAIYTWTFGDGDSSHQQNPHHVYAPGSYQACLTVSVISATGIVCTDTYCDSIHVPPMPCNAHFSHSSGNIPNLVHFNSLYNAPNTTYNWSFGDGTFSSMPDPHHIYAPGHYNACLTITTIGPAGNVLCTANWCDSIHVAPAPNCYANFSYHQLQSPLTYAFNNLSSPNATGYFWHFGDGSVSFQKDPVHQYAHHGHFQVCVTMIDTVNHCSKTRCRILSVHNMASMAVQNTSREGRQLESEYNINIYPNPASDKLNVTIDDMTDEVLVEIYDSTGRLADSKTFSEYAEISLDRFDQGLYIYKIIHEGRLLDSGKFVKSE